MTSPAQLTLRAWRNAVFPLNEYRLVDSAGDPIDLTGATLQFQVRDYDGAPTARVTANSTSGSGDRIEKSDAAQGRFLIHVAASTLNGLPSAADQGKKQNKPATFRHDLRIDLGDGYEIYFYGDFELMTGVTR